MKSQLSSYCKALLLLEFIFAFSMPVSALILGLTFGLFFAIAIALNGEPAALLMLVITIGGLVGMIGVSQLLLAALDGEYKSIKFKSFWYVVLGCISVIPLTLQFLQESEWYWWGVGLAPHFVALQLVWLNKKALFGTAK